MIETGIDPCGYGRWTYKQNLGRHKIFLLVISGYRVGTRSTSAVPSTAWSQQKVLIAKDRRQLYPQEAFIRDMEDWLAIKMSDNTEIVFF